MDYHINYANRKGTLLFKINAYAKDDDMIEVSALHQLYWIFDH